MHSVCGLTNFYGKMDRITSKSCIQCQIIEAQPVLGGKSATINTNTKPHRSIILQTSELGHSLSA